MIQHFPRELPLLDPYQLPLQRLHWISSFPSIVEIEHDLLMNEKCCLMFDIHPPPPSVKLKVNEEGFDVDGIAENVLDEIFLKCSSSFVFLFLRFMIHVVSSNAFHLRISVLEHLTKKISTYFPLWLWPIWVSTLPSSQVHLFDWGWHSLKQLWAQVALPELARLKHKELILL